MFSWPGTRIEGQSLVRIQLNGLFTKLADRVGIIGNCPELGNWDVSKAVMLEYVNLNLWFSEVAFSESAGKTVAYKFVLFHSDPNLAPQRESRTGRTRPIPESGVAKWRDVWEE